MQGILFIIKIRCGWKSYLRIKSSTILYKKTQTKTFDISYPVFVHDKCWGHHRYNKIYSSASIISRPSDVKKMNGLYNSIHVADNSPRLTVMVLLGSRENKRDTSDFTTSMSSPSIGIILLYWITFQRVPLANLSKSKPAWTEMLETGGQVPVWARAGLPARKRARREARGRITQLVIVLYRNDLFRL